MKKKMQLFQLESMDGLDRTILYELDRNSRQPFAAIARRVGASKETVARRIDGLTRRGLIGRFSIFSDVSQMGFSYFKMYIRLNFAGAEKEKQIVDFLCKQALVSWVVACDGKYDLVVNVVTNSVGKFEVLTASLRERFGSVIQTMDVTTVTRILRFDRAYLTGAERSIRPQRQQNRIPALDSRDAACLALLSLDSRASLGDLGRRVKISPEAVRKRIRSLVENGAIEKFSVELNYPSFNYQYFKMMLKFQNLTEEKKKRFRAYCAHHPNVLYWVEGIGVSDVDVDLEVRDPKQFHEIILDMKKKFGGIIKDYEILIVTQEFKYDLFSPLKKLVET